MKYVATSRKSVATKNKANGNRTLSQHRKVCRDKRRQEFTKVCHNNCFYVATKLLTWQGKNVATFETLLLQL